MTDEVAKAYIQLIPSASGIKGAITKELGGDVESEGAALGSRFSKSFGGALAGLGKIVTGAVAAGAAAAGALAKGAVEKFADYEQLVGGVETLFKDSADAVQEYAAEAFKTAGLSANEYMETVTGFSASLIQSLGGDTAKAAEIADMAITDMSDNANKMGSSMESIQNAYQGFAKQNFTMLDNLKLGYGGTQAEMERLLADATALSGVEYDISSFADVAEAIHVIQDELGIAGTTAKEAGETISGSVAAMKSAWDNLVAGLADENADLDALIDNLVESAETALGNIFPVAEKALGGIAELIEKLAPVIAEKLPELVETILPSVVKAAIAIVQALIDTLNDDDAADALVGAAVDILLVLVDAIADNMDIIIEAASKIIVALLEKLTEEETLEKLVEAAVKLIVAIAEGLLGAAENILEALAQVFVKILEAIGAWEMDLFDKGKALVEKIGQGIADAAKNALNWGRDLIDNFVQGIKDRIQHVIDTVKQIAENIKKYLGFSEPELGPLSDFHTYAPDMMDLFAEGIRENARLITDAVDGAFDLAPQITNYAVGGKNGFVPDSGTSNGSTPFPVGGEIVFNVTETIDGEVLARNQYRLNLAEQNRRGGNAYN